MNEKDNTIKKKKTNLAEIFNGNDNMVGVTNISASTSNPARKDVDIVENIDSGSKKIKIKITKLIYMPKNLAERINEAREVKNGTSVNAFILQAIDEKLTLQGK